MLHTADNLANESPGTDARRAWAGAAYAILAGPSTESRTAWPITGQFCVRAPDPGYRENALQAVVDYVVTTYDIQEPTS